MAWPVYTERFLLIAGTGTWTYYTVPAGKRAIVASVLGTNGGASANTVNVAIAGETVMRDSLPGSGTSRAYSLRLAAYAGEQIGAFAPAGCTITVGGYLFTSPSGALEDGPPPEVEGDPPADFIVVE